MTQKELLLKDLCGRLPYGVICEDGYGNILELNGIDKPNTITFKCSNNTFWATDLDKCKPYLIPLSSMTEEQLFEVQEIFGKNDIKIEDSLLRIVNSERNTISYLEILALLKWFYKNHFDVYGLIPMGLANDATGLKIY